MSRLSQQGLNLLYALGMLLIMLILLYFLLHLGATRAPAPFSGIFSKAQSLAQAQS